MFSIAIGFQLQLDFRKKTFNTFSCFYFSFIYKKLSYGYTEGLFLVMQYI